MSIHNAKKFISRIMEEPSLRDRLNGASSIDELFAVLVKEGIPFTHSEFEEAYSNRLVSCQFEEQASHLNELKMWWKLLLGILGSGAEATSGWCTSGATCSAGGCSGCS